MAADSTVRLIVDAAKAVNPLRAVAASSKKAEQAIEKLKGAVERTTRKFSQLKKRATDSLKSIAKKARDAAASTGKFGKAAIAAAAAAAAIGTIKFAFTQAGELERQTKSLQVLTGSLDTAKGIISELQDFGAVTPFTSTELIETGKRLKAFGFETEKIVDVTKRLADVAGATGADLGGIATAFGQIQAKGRLQGEELLQLQERGVSLQDELQKMYGLTGDEFRKALEGGRISADAVNLALVKLTEAGGKYANGAIAQSDTLFGKLSTLQDALQRFGQNIGKVLDPIFKGIIGFLTTITNQINNLFKEAEISAQARKNLGFDAEGKGRLSQKEQQQLRQERARLRAANKAAGDAPVIPSVAGAPPALLAGTSGAGTGKSQAEKEADRLKRLAGAQAERVQGLIDERSLKLALNEEERRSVQLNIDLRKIMEQTAELGEAATRREIEKRLALEDATIAANEYGKTLKLQKEQEDERAKQRKKDAKELEDQQKQAAQRIADRYKAIGDTIKTGIVDGLKSAIDGTKSLAEVASNVLNNLTNQLLNMAVSMGLTALGGAVGGPLAALFPKRAKGGTVTGGRSYLVGERGPELFTPGRTGSVTPNNALMGNSSIVVNVDATGSTVEGDAGQAKQLGDAIGVAIRQELLKQKRPGGLLA